MKLVILILFLISISRCSYDYCQAPIVTSSEEIDGLRLALVQGISRHGDRTPVNYLGPNVDNQPVVWNCGLNSYEYPVDGGDDFEIRSPGRLFRKVSQKVEILPGNCLYGQLTSKGLKQAENYGKSLRDLYINKYQFLPSELDQLTHHAFRFRSTDIPRTLQSAQGQINGLYPPHESKRLQSIDLFTRDTDVETMLANDATCPALKRRIEYLVSTDEYVDHKNAMKPIIKYLESIWNTTTLPSWSGIMDVFETRICHQLPLPKGVTQNIVQTIKAEANWEFSYLVNDAIASKLSMGFFTQEILDNIENYIHQKSSVMYYLYSAHDTTVGPLLGNWGVYDNQWPPYLSNVQVELWVNDTAVSTNDKYFVQVKYNGQVLTIPNCSSVMCNYYEEWEPYISSRTATKADCQ